VNPLSLLLFCLGAALVAVVVARRRRKVEPAAAAKRAPPARAKPIRGLRSAAALERPPTGDLSAYLRILANLLEEAYALKFGFFLRRKIDPAEAARLTEELRRLANAGFAHALAVRPGEVLRWLAELNDLQKPEIIDLAAWEAQARGLPASTGAVALPPPSPLLRQAVDALRAKQPTRIGPPAPIDLVEQVAEIGSLPPELLAFYQLATKADIELGSYELRIPELVVRSKLETGFMLLHWSARKNPWIYHYRFEDDGAVAQISWHRSDELHQLDPPRRAAGSLAEFLTAALAPERLVDVPPRWSPGPLLPEPGERAKPTKAPRAVREIPPAEQIRASLADIITRYRFNPHLRFLCSSAPPSAEKIEALQARLKARLPPEYVAFLSAYGWVVFEAKEAEWARPNVGDVGPAWSFEYGVSFLGIGADVPEMVDIETVSALFAEENADDDPEAPRLLPFCKIPGSRDYYCFDEAGDLFLVYPVDPRPSPIPLGFVQFFEQQIAELAERTKKKLQS
jgi:hypothetical protein